MTGRQNNGFDASSIKVRELRTHIIAHYVTVGVVEEIAGHFSRALIRQEREAYLKRLCMVMLVISDKLRELIPLLRLQGDAIRGRLALRRAGTTISSTKRETAINTANSAKDGTNA